MICIKRCHPRDKETSAIVLYEKHLCSICTICVLLTANLDERFTRPMPVSVFVRVTTASNHVSQEAGLKSPGRDPSGDSSDLSGSSSSSVFTVVGSDHD